MRLTRLAGRNFMAFEQVDLDLSGTNAVAITGKNNHGKSALLDILVWAIKGEVQRDIPSKDSIIRDGTDAVYARVEFTYGRDAEHHAEVVREKQRGRTATLSLTVDGAQATLHTITETETAIERLIGLDYAGLMAGPIMAQEGASSFMKARPADRKDLLARLFGLDRYERYWREANDRHREAKGKLAIATDAMVAASTTIDREPAAREALKAENLQLARAEADRDAATKRIGAAREKLAALGAQTDRTVTLQLQRDNLLARITANGDQRSRLETRLATARSIATLAPPTFDADALRRAEDQVTAGQQADVERHRLVASVASAVAARSAADREVAHMTAAREKRSTVPCGGLGEFAVCRFLTDIPDDAAMAAAIAAAEVEASSAGMAQMALAALPAYDTDRARATVAELRSEMESVRRTETIRAGAVATIAEGDAAMAQLIDAGVALEAELERVRAELVDAERAASDAALWRNELTRATADKDSADAHVNRCRFTLREVEAQIAHIDAAKAAHEAAAATVAELSPLAESLRLLAEAFHRDGIPTRILTHGIPLIEAEANRVLERLPGSFTIALRTQRAKATGGMAETLDVVVTVGGWEREYGLLSVGARFRVDLALRLGLTRVLTHRTGSTIDTLWLDEPLAALDEEGRLAVKEALAALSDEIGLIVAVSHHPDFNDAFGARIDVVQVDEISTATLAA